MTPRVVKMLTIRMIFTWNLEQCREGLLISIDLWADLVGDL